MPTLRPALPQSGMKAWCHKAHGNGPCLVDAKTNVSTNKAPQKRCLSWFVCVCMGGNSQPRTFNTWGMTRNEVETGGPAGHIYMYNIYIQYTHNIWYIIYYNQCFAYVCLNILLADWPKFPGLNLREKAIDASQNFGDKCRSNDAAELRYISTACLLFVMSPDTNCLVSSSFFYFRTFPYFFQVGVKQLACLLFHLTRFFQWLKIRVHPGWSSELLDHQGMW